jgi:fibronectin type 3 domain-containing protein
MKNILLILVSISFFIPSVHAQTNYALKFDGTNGSASMTMNTGNTNSTATVEMWFTQVTAQSGTQYLADLHSISGINRRRVMPYLNSSTIGVYCAPNTGNDNNAITESTGITVSTNVWYHIAVAVNGSTLKMYVNGKLYVTTSLTDSYALTGTEILSLAMDYWNTAYANIKVDEVRVWSTERTEAEIKTNMYKELAGSEAGLLSYYKMSNGSGSSLSDNQTAGSYNGTLSGGYTWVASGSFADDRNALDFDGSNDYIDCGNSASVQRNGTQSFTLETWVKPIGGVWVATISKFVHTASQEGYSLEIFSDNRVALLYGNNWSDWNAATSSTPLIPGVWSHIAATYDGTTVKIYINGLLSQSATWTNGLTDSGTDLLLASRSGTTFYLGQMDEVRVWTVARTQAEIQESMCRTLVGTEAGLAAYYRLDQIDGSTTYDLTSNANNGTLTNMDPSTDWVASDAFNTWIGAESTLWSAAGNWSKGAAPTSSNSVGLYKWALGNEAAISSSPTINNLFISSTASPTLSSSATINMNLLLGKDFDLNGQSVTLGSTGNLVEGAYRLKGTAGTISTTRNLSNISALDVAGLGAKISTAANMGSTTIARGHTQQTSNGNVSILRYYDIAPTNNSSLNASLVFNYNDSELNSLTENTLILFKSTNSGTSWTNEGGILNAANNTVTKTAIPGFSRWTLGSSSLSLENIPPTAPQNLIVTDSSNQTIALKWRKNTEIDFQRYRIYRGTSPNPSTQIDSTSGGITDTTRAYSGLVNGTRYYFRVKAVDIAGNESGYSNEVNAASADRIAPAVPQNLVVIDSSTQTITIAWQKNTEPDFQRYQIYCEFTPNPTTSATSTTGGITDTTKTFNGLVNGMRYYFRVTAVDIAGNESGYSNEVNAVPADRIVPAAPQHLVVIDSTGQTITITWQKNTETDVHKYRIYCSTSPISTALIDSATGGITDTTKAITGLIIGMRYYFRIAAVDNSGNESRYSNEVNSVPYADITFADGLFYNAPAVIPNKSDNPVGRFKLTAAADGAKITSITVTFSGTYSGISTVKLWSSPDSIFGGDTRIDSAIYYDSLVTLNRNVSAIDMNGTYYFITVDLGPSGGDINLKIANNAAFTFESGILVSSINNAVLNKKRIPLSVEKEINVPREFTLNQNYPNPFNPSTTIKYGLPSRSTVRLVIYNILGQVVSDLVSSEQHAGIQSVVWNANVSSGLYFYRLEATSIDDPSKRFVETKKMLLIR